MTCIAEVDSTDLIPGHRPLHYYSCKTPLRGRLTGNRPAISLLLDWFDLRLSPHVRAFMEMCSHTLNLVGHHTVAGEKHVAEL